MIRICLVGALAFVSTSARAQELTLPEVLRSAAQHHPRVAAALAREDIARADLVAARGAFDPTLSARGALRMGGYYELRRMDVELRQGTPLWGADVFAGYRFARGVREQRYPTYYGDETRGGGELRVGVAVPLWRGGPLDERRAARRRGQHRLEAASSAREATALELRRWATDAYVAWATAGRQLTFVTELLELAERRYTWVEARVGAGALAPIDLLEAERAVLGRRRAAIVARRRTEAASLVLSLFHRDSEGRPSRPGLEVLPNGLLDLDPMEANAARPLHRVVQCHPELAGRRARLEALTVDRALSQAQRAPRVDLNAEVSRDLGRGDETLAGTVFEVGLLFEMPLGLRALTGRARAAAALVEAAEEELRLAEDTLRVRLADTLSAYRAAEERRALAASMVANLRAVAEAERRRFADGASQLFMVNQREQALAEAGLAEADATREVWRARAAWDAWTACPGTAPGD